MAINLKTVSAIIQKLMLIRYIKQIKKQQLSTKILTLISVIIFIIFTLFRFMYLDRFPSGFFVDESSIGSNALSILNRGTDEYSTSFPLFFKAFGDYKNPIFIYSAVPILAIFGNTISAVRLTSALWGFASVIAYAFLIKKFRFTLPAKFLSILLLITSPWMVQQSRVAFEVASAPFFLILAILAFYSLTEEKKLSNKKLKNYLVLFSISLGLSFFTYTAMRLVAPIMFVIGLFLIYKKIGWKLISTSVSLFTLCLIPLLISETVMSGALSSRYDIVGLSSHVGSVLEFITKFFNNYISHFSLRFLFRGGDDNLRHIPSFYSIFYISSLPFLIWGLISLYLKRHRPFFKWLGLLLLLGPVPAALTIQSPHILRSVSFITSMFVVVALGVQHGFTYSEKSKKLTIIIWILISIQSLMFLRFYTTNYQFNSRVWFDANTSEVVEKIPNFKKTIFVSEKLYLGTYSTAEFFANDKKGETKIKIIPLLKRFPDVDGTYILDQTSCFNITEYDRIPGERCKFFANSSTTCACSF